MNIQIFGKSKCFDTKKAERYFKERRIKYQYIDLIKYGMSRGELNSVISALGLDNLVDPKDVDFEIEMDLESTKTDFGALKMRIDSQTLEISDGEVSCNFLILGYIYI